MPRYLRAAVFAAPGVALAVVGATHPIRLTFETSGRWTVIHVIGLLVFPLVGAALVGLVWPRRDPLAVAIALAAYVYATAYTALDVVSGIGAGFVTYRAGAGERPEEVRVLYEIGSRLGEYGGWAIVVAAVLVAGDQVLRHRLHAIAPGLLLVGAALLFRENHIFPWLGVLSVLVIGLATGWLAALSPARVRPSSTAG